MFSLISPVLADISWTVRLLAIVFVVISIFMMLVILIQKPKGGGLSGAFGGAGGGETSFVGAKIGDFLTWLTVGCFVAFLLLAMLLTWNINPEQNQAKAAADTSNTATGVTVPLDEIPDGATNDPGLGDDPAETVDAEIEAGADAIDVNLETGAEAVETPATDTASTPE